MDRVQSNRSETVVIIPTRNRADLAISAIRSVLNEPVDDVRVLVSDNSTAESEKIALADFCRQLLDPCLLYVVPPEALVMTEHWDWAMQPALQLPRADHFIYLTDRSIFRPGALASIIEISQRNPDKVVSYDWVTIFDHLDPILVETKHQTGRVVEVSASRLLSLSSESVLPNCLPRMMNCCVPRSVVEVIKTRFGNVFDSISPDYNFCYRCLEVVDSILYYDLAAFVSYALPRSNGVNLIGISTDANRDFIANLAPDTVATSLVPVPEFETPANYVLQEYCLVQRETGSSKFPEIDLVKYLARNASNISSIQDSERKREMEALLKATGYRALPPQWLKDLRGRLSLRTRIRRALRGERSTLSSTAGPFASVAEAIEYAVNVPLRTDPDPYHLRVLRE